MDEPTFVPTKPLASAALELIGAEPREVLVLGSRRVTTALLRAGHRVTLWMPSDPGGPSESGPNVVTGPLDSFPGGHFEALVSICIFATRDDPLADLRRLLRALRPRARVILAEQAPSTAGGRWLARLFRRVSGRPFAMDPADVAALCLNAGVAELAQAWPQGLRSLVLTTGRRNPVVDAVQA